MKKRLLYLVKFYVTTVLVFIAAKLVFMFCYRASHPFSVGDVFDVARHGLTLDLSTALYFLLVPFLAVLAGIWAKVPAWLLKSYYVLTAIAFALAFVADTSLYAFWNFKLDASCLAYLETPTEAMASVTTGYLLMRLLAFLLVTIGIYIVYSLQMPQMLPASTLRARLGQTAFGLLFIPLIIIGIRGGVGESTTNIGQVYYSQRQFLNHAAVNPVFSFLSSLEKSANYVPDYQFMDEKERAAIMRDLYPTESVQPDTLLLTDRPNVVIILLESCGGVFTQDIGGRADVMPHLHQLTQEGVYFANFYANSYRTDRGTLCTWSGYPSFPRSSVMKMPAKTRLLPGIAASLLKEGYSTTYLYGGDINFTNMRSYLIGTGFERLYWQADYSAEEQRSAQWGVRDDITFGTLGELIEKQSTEASPFLIGYSTLSSHEPWDVPTHRLADEVLNAFNYLDECIGHFIAQVRQTPAWDNLLVILLPDHGFSYGDVGEEHPMHDHVPMLWIGGAVKEPRRVELLCNQTDLPATLLGQMGIGHADFLFSRDVMSRNYLRPFAVHTYNNGITMRDSTGFAVFDLNANKIVVDQSSDAPRLIQTGKAILQTAAENLKNLN